MIESWILPGKIWKKLEYEDLVSVFKHILIFSSELEEADEVLKERRERQEPELRAQRQVTARPSRRAPTVTYFRTNPALLCTFCQVIKKR